LRSSTNLTLLPLTVTTSTLTGPERNMKDFLDTREVMNYSMPSPMSFLLRVFQKALTGELKVLSLLLEIRVLAVPATPFLLWVVSLVLGSLLTMNLLNSLFSRLSTAPWTTRITVARVAGKRMSMTTLSGILSCLSRIIPTREKMLGAHGNHLVLPMLTRSTSSPTVMLTS